MNDLMTLAEIESRFASEWVLIEEPEVDDQMQVVRGRVAAHSKDRDEVDRRMIELRLGRAATVFTGVIPDNTAVIL